MGLIIVRIDVIEHRISYIVYATWQRTHAQTTKIHSNEDKSLYCHNQLNAGQQKLTIKVVVKRKHSNHICVVVIVAMEHTLAVSVWYSHTNTHTPHDTIRYNDFASYFPIVRIVHRTIYRNKRASHAFEGIQRSRQMTVAFTTPSTYKPRYICRTHYTALNTTHLGHSNRRNK